VRPKIADVVSVVARAEISAVEVVHEREDAAADGDPRLAFVPGFLPRRAEGLDVPGLHDVERVAAGVVVDQGRAHQVHAQGGRPGCGRGRSCAPPDPVAQAWRVRFDGEQARRVGEHRPWVRLGESLTSEHVQEHLGVAACHVGVALTLRRLVAEVAPAVDHLLW
jgi:hypothetical protein